MPNIQTKHLKLLKFPQNYKEFKYEFIATSNRGEKLIFVRHKEQSFFLQITQRESDFLIKSDKLSKVSPVSVMQNALKGFCVLHNLDLTFSNIETKHHKLKSDLGILKKPQYFSNELKYEKDIWIEVGFGSGRHLLHQAKENPNINFIGLEIHKPSIEQLIKQCKLQNIKNIKICDFDARVFMQVLNSNSVGKIFVHFPIPWDKKPHRRVISKDFFDECMRALKVEGTIWLRTDSENYFSYTFETLQKLDNYEIKIRKNHDLQISSKYEDRWKKQEKNIYDIIFINHQQSKKKSDFDELTFEEYPDFKRIKDKFTNHTLKGKDYFVHFEEIYEIDEKSGVIKLSLGSFEKSEHKYLLFKDNMVKYFPTISLAIKQNLTSHKKIKGFLYD